MTGTNASPGLFEVIWVVGKDEVIGRLEDAANGKCTVREPPAPPPAKTEEAPPPAAAKTEPLVLSGDLDAQAKAVGDEIRNLKAKLKADGVSGKKIDKMEEVVALVAKLTAVKAAAAAGPAQTAAPAAPAPAAAAAVPSGDLEAQVKAVGDEIRALKAKLKADGISNKKVDKNEEVVALVAKLNELKAAQA